MENDSQNGESNRKSSFWFMRRILLSKFESALINFNQKIRNYCPINLFHKETSLDFERKYLSIICEIEKLVFPFFSIEFL